MPGFKCGYCHERHSTVDEVRACGAAGSPVLKATVDQPPTKLVPMITPAQRSFLVTLISERPAYCDVMNYHADSLDTWTKAMASAAITELKAQPKEVATQAPTAQELSEDELKVRVYILPDGSIVQVKPNKAKTKVYAKRWTAINGTRLTLSDEHVKGEWRYEAGLIHQVKDEYRMTVEQAKRFILVYGQCARCARKLKAAKSVEQGIGPVCIKYFGGALVGA